MKTPTSKPQLRSGESVQDAVTAMLKENVKGILFNCCQPEVIEQALVLTQNELKAQRAEHVQVGAYANAFAPQTKEATANRRVR
ncbi:homocysteine S-methyltransferase family protein [Pseudoalteromonas sp. Hal099]